MPGDRCAVAVAGGASCDTAAVAVRTATPEPPKARSRSAPVIMPGRRMTASRPVRSTTVLSIPTELGPPSRMSSTRSPSDACTCWALVGLTWVNRLALGAAMGTPAARSRANATGWAGIRTATASSPAVATSGTCAALGSTRVSGPGQKAAARRSAAGGQCRVSARAAATSGTWAMTGFHAGRPLAVYTATTASGSSALAPKPYTVSVGNATSFPRRSSAAACSTTTGSGLFGSTVRSGAPAMLECSSSRGQSR